MERAQQQAPLRASYHIRVTRSRVTIELELSGRASQQVQLAVTDTNGALTDLDLIRQVTSQPSEALVPTPSRWGLILPASGRAVVSYELVTQRNTSGVPGAMELPLLDEHHVFIMGLVSFVVPTEPVAGPVAIRWTLPTGWTAATGFGEAADSIGVLRSSYLVAGKLQRRLLDAGAASIDLVWVGPGTIADSTAEQILTQTFAAATAIANHDGAHYFVVLRATVPGSSFGGTPGHESMQMIVPENREPNEVVDVRGYGFPVLPRVLAHEYLHTWGARPLPDTDWGPPLAAAPEAGGSLRWYYEGFVDYMAHRALLVGGVVEPDTFVTGMRALAEELPANPHYGRVSLVDASEAFFDDEDILGLSYSGGMMLALLCDIELRAHGAGTLVDFMAKAPPARPVDTLEQWLATWRAHVGARWAGPDLEQWLTRAQPLPVDAYIDRVETVVALSPK